MFRPRLHYKMGLPLHTTTTFCLVNPVNDNRSPTHAFHERRMAYMVACTAIQAWPSEVWLRMTCLMGVLSTGLAC